MRSLSRIAAIAALPVFLFGLAACADDGKPAASGSPSAERGAPAADGSKADFEKAMLEYTKCMRDEGIDMPDPDLSGGGAVMLGPADANAYSKEELEAAGKKCNSLLPKSDLSPEDEAKFQESMVKFAACMREQGIDMPDPGPDGSMSVTDGGDQAAMEKAQAKCAPLLESGDSADSGKGK